MPKLRVYKMRADAIIPRYETSGAAGMDLAACLDTLLTIEPGDTARVPTGLRIALPPGHEGQVRPRSGLAARRGVTVLNAPGTIDEDYRGVKAILSFRPIKVLGTACVAARVITLSPSDAYAPLSP